MTHRPDPRPGAGSPPAGGTGTAPPAAELSQILAVVVPPGGGFGHREHIHLAFLAVTRYGPAAAAGVVGGWLRELTARHGAPQKFHATVTRAWTELVAYHAAECAPGTGFAAFLARNPGLLDKHLLTRHYSAGLLASPAARAGWAEPDLLPFPWQGRPGPMRT